MSLAISELFYVLFDAFSIVLLLVSDNSSGNSIIPVASYMVSERGAVSSTVLVELTMGRSCSSSSKRRYLNDLIGGAFYQLE